MERLLRVCLTLEGVNLTAEDNYKIQVEKLTAAQITNLPRSSREKKPAALFPSRICCLDAASGTSLHA